jgi:hypothetical protein
VSAAYVDPAGSCGGNTPCYTTIQAAIDAAGAGVVIKIKSGTYPENAENLPVIRDAYRIDPTFIGFLACHKLVGPIKIGSTVIYLIKFVDPVHAQNGHPKAQKRCKLCHLFSFIFYLTWSDSASGNEVPRASELFTDKPIRPYPPVHKAATRIRIFLRKQMLSVEFKKIFWNCHFFLDIIFEAE